MFSGKVWDKKTAINDVSAKDIIASYPVLKNGEAALVLQENIPIVFQTHDPDFEGIMPMSYERAFSLALTISESYNNSSA